MKLFDHGPSEKTVAHYDGIVNTLLDHGANPNGNVPLIGKAPIDFAVSAKTVIRLIDSGVTPTHRAIKTLEDAYNKIDPDGTRAEGMQALKKESLDSYVAVMVMGIRGADQKKGMTP